MLSCNIAIIAENTNRKAFFTKGHKVDKLLEGIDLTKSVRLNEVKSIFGEDFYSSRKRH